MAMIIGIRFRIRQAGNKKYDCKKSDARLSRSTDRYVIQG